MGKRALSILAVAAMLAATALPARAQTFLPQAPQIREMPGSRWQGGGQRTYRTYLPQAPQIRDYGYRYRRGHYEHRRGHGYMPYNYAPRRCYTGPEWVWHGYPRGWVWQNVTRC